MRFLPYLLRHLRWNWFRAGLTAAAMALCIFLFCTLQSVLAEIETLLAGTNARLLVSRNAAGVMFDLPLSYGSRISSLAGVERVAAAAWFGGALPSRIEEKGPEESTA